ncbi:MAG: heavy-metal-associated domain-containing protein [Gammaproteobacteria bacterium]|jgi:copper chaperone
MQHVIEVENIKCGGCASTIKGKLGALDGVSAVQVDVENGRITLEAPADSRASLVKTLLASGYPEKGSVEGIKAAGAKARSFVSCAIGRMGS